MLPPSATMATSHPCSRASRAFSAVETVPITRAPSALPQLAQEQADAAGRRMHEDRLARAHRVRAMQQVLRRHALQHQRRRRLVADVVGQRDDVRGGDACARRRTRRAAARHRRRGRPAAGARRPAPTSITVPAASMPGGAGGSSIAVAAGAHVDVDVVDADGRVPDPHFAAARARAPRACAGARTSGPPWRETTMPRAGIASAGRAGARRAAVPPRRRYARNPCEAAFVDAPADQVGELALAPARRLERRLPVPERALAVGDALERDRRDVAAHRDRRVEDAVGRDVVAVGQRQQLLADVVAVVQREVAHAADLVGGSPRSIDDSATTGCHAVWLLKSRRTAQTRSIGASMIAERVTRITALGVPAAGSSAADRQPPAERARRSAPERA